MNAPSTRLPLRRDRSSTPPVGGSSPQSGVVHSSRPSASRPSARGVKPRIPPILRLVAPAGKPRTSTAPPESPTPTSMSVAATMHGKKSPSAAGSCRYSPFSVTAPERWMSRPLISTASPISMSVHDSGAVPGSMTRVPPCPCRSCSDDPTGRGLVRRRGSSCPTAGTCAVRAGTARASRPGRTRHARCDHQDQGP